MLRMKCQGVKTSLELTTMMTDKRASTTSNTNECQRTLIQMTINDVVGINGVIHLRYSLLAEVKYPRGSEFPCLWMVASQACSEERSNERRLRREIRVSRLNGEWARLMVSCLSLRKPTD